MANSVSRITLAVLIALVLPGAGRCAASPPTPFPNGLHCGDSQGAYGDILPEEDGKPGTWVVGIDKIMHGRDTVGYVYSMRDGVRLMQPTYAMPAKFVESIGVEPLHIKLMPPHLPAALRIVSCPASQLKMRQTTCPTVNGETRLVRSVLSACSAGISLHKQAA